MNTIQYDYEDIKNYFTLHHVEKIKIIEKPDTRPLLEENV